MELVVLPANGIADGLIRAVAEKDGAGRLQKDLHIQPERPRSRILEIEPDHVVEPQSASPVDLPEAGEPWPDLEQPPAVPDVIRLDFRRDRRTRPPHPPP